MNRRFLPWKLASFAAVLFFSGMAHAQNSQCTLLSAQDFGKVVPITVNPAPALNALCKVGSEAGYVSRTSSGIGVNVNADCSVTVSGHTIKVAYEAHPSVIKAPCTVGGVSGVIVDSFAPANRPSPPTVPSIPIFYSWVPSANGSVPQFAVVGGSDKVQYHSDSTAITYGNPFYVCRAALNGSVFPGRVVGKNCSFSAATEKEILVSSYEVLTANPGAYSLSWQTDANPPPHSIVGGHWGEKLYLCQVPYKEGIYLGWASTGTDGKYVCYIGWNKQEAILPGPSFLVPIKGIPID